MSDNSRTKRLADFLGRSVMMIYTIIFVCIVGVCLLFSKMEYVGQFISGEFISAFILLPLGVAFIWVLYRAVNKIEVTDSNKRNILFWGGSFVVFVGQIILARNYYFYTDWDVSFLVPLADNIAHDGIIEPFEFYFSRYPNNLFLAYIFAGIVKVSHYIGLHEHEYFVLIAVQCLLNSMTGLLLTKVLEKIFKNTTITLTGYILYVALIGMSPWVSIPYSDSMSLIFPVCILYLYVIGAEGKTDILLSFLIALLAFVGFKVKPQVLITFIAIVVAEIIKVFKNGATKKHIYVGIAMLVGLVVGFWICRSAVNSIDININQEQSFGFPHYFMMGMNEDKKGGYSDKDVDFSGNFSTRKERNAADLKEGFKRISNMGVKGTVVQFVRKTLTNYNDGTFCWSGEGKFFYELRPEKNTLLCKFARGLYYTRSCGDIGIFYKWWANFVQMIWLGILFISIFSFLERDDKGELMVDINKITIMLGIIGLTIFELLFEARARYLFSYSPFYIILAMYGVYNISCIIKRKP